MTKKKKAASKAKGKNAPKQPAKPPKPAAKASVPAKTPKAMLAVADERFKKDAQELRTRRRTMAGDLLQYRYDIGLLATRIADEKSKVTHERYYGSHTVADAARILEEAPATIYACLKFVKQIDRKQLEELKAKEWPWRAVSSLFTIDDQKVRKQLQADFEKGKFDTSDDFRIEVRKTNEADRATGTKTETRGRGGSGGQAASMVNSCDTVGAQFVKRVVPEFIHKDLHQEPSEDVARDGGQDRQRRQESDGPFLGHGEAYPAGEESREGCETDPGGPPHCRRGGGRRPAQDWGRSRARSSTGRSPSYRGTRVAN